MHILAHACDQINIEMQVWSIFGNLNFFFIEPQNSLTDYEMPRPLILPCVYMRILLRECEKAVPKEWIAVFWT